MSICFNWCLSLWIVEGDSASKPVTSKVPIECGLRIKKALLPLNTSSQDLQFMASGPWNPMSIMSSSLRGFQGFFQTNRRISVASQAKVRRLIRHRTMRHGKVEVARRFVSLPISTQLVFVCFFPYRDVVKLFCTRSQRSENRLVNCCYQVKLAWTKSTQAPKQQPPQPHVRA